MAGPPSVGNNVEVWGVWPALQMLGTRHLSGRRDPHLLHCREQRGQGMKGHHLSWVGG